MDEPTFYPTLPALPYPTNPYAIAPPPPITQITKRSSKRRLFAELGILALLLGLGLVIMYETANYEYNQGVTAGNNTSHAETGNLYNSGYRAGYSDGESKGYSKGRLVGYKAGKHDGYTAGKQDGYSLGVTDGNNQALNDLFIFVNTPGGSTTAKTCIHTTDQSAYVYFQVTKDATGKVSYACLV